VRLTSERQKSAARNSPVAAVLAAGALSLVAMNFGSANGCGTATTPTPSSGVIRTKEAPHETPEAETSNPSVSAVETKAREKNSPDASVPSNQNSKLPDRLGATWQINDGAKWERKRELDKEYARWSCASNEDDCSAAVFRVPYGNCGGGDSDATIAVHKNRVTIEVERSCWGGVVQCHYWGEVLPDGSAASGKYWCLGDSSRDYTYRPWRAQIWHVRDPSR